jgi:hypothetical protein
MPRTKELSDIDEGLLAAAEADLDRLLAIEPSAEFAARVRQRIASEPSVSGWRWRRAALTLVAVVALIVVLRLGRSVVPESPGPVHAALRADIMLADTPPETGAGIVRSTPAGIRGPAHARRPAPPPADAAEVIIDPAVADAIRRLMMSTEVSLQTTSDARAQDTAAALTVAEPLDVPELVLKPAEQSGGQ